MEEKMTKEEPNPKKSGMKEKMGDYIKKVKEDEGIKKKLDFFWGSRMEMFSGALILIGIVLAFFYIHIGGALVGLGFGICFFEDIKEYFTRLRDFYTEQGLFKTLLFVGAILYFLIAIPFFIIAVAIGFGAMYLIYICSNKKSS